MQEVPPTQEDHRALFFEEYRKEAEDYDEEFMKKYDEDLNTTLIFVSFVSPWLDVYTLTQYQAGLFSAVTSAFILDVQSQLKPDAGDETAALIRVLIDKVDNTTFGDNTPTIPQWTGPPHTIVQVQAILYASLAASLFSAFLAMLGKQWLNRYASTELRGTAIERSQNRQRKLDGIVTWYFDYVMESLPLMLQIALLLLGCALSRYLWEINTTVAWVVLGVTSAGVISYMFIVVVGTASESCPYQTPASNALRYLWPRVQRRLYSVASVFKESKTIRITRMNVHYHRPWWARHNIVLFLTKRVFGVPRVLAIDAYHLGRAMSQSLATLLVSLSCMVYSLLHGTTSTPKQEPDQQATVLDLRCISWMFQTSLDKAVHLSILKHLATMTTLADLDPTLVIVCLNTFLGCVKMDTRTHEVVIVQGLEQLAIVSAQCVLNTISHLLVIDPTSSVIEDLRQRYIQVLSPHTDFHGHQFYYTMNATRYLLLQWWGHGRTYWDQHKPLTDEHTIVTRNLVKVAQVGYQRIQKAKVPRWILLFTFYSLSLDPLPPTPVIADCLSIIAIELGCDISGIVAADERCVHIPEITTVLTLNQRPGAESSIPNNSEA